LKLDLLTPQHWKSYQLLDSGNFEKLEKFGPYVLSRPEPQAAWDKSLSEKEWEERANAVFKKEANNPDKGSWNLKKGMPQNWFINYESQNLKLKVKLSLSSFKHVGLFPEQAANWEYIYDQVSASSVQKPKILNLFAYTGMASVAARQAGADVTHLDSVKQVVTWARENMEANNLDNIRWMVDDAMKFVKREVKRGNRYNGLILDPPAYGRGPEGEKWVLEDQINEMLKLCSEIIDPENHFVILNMYSLGFSALIADNLMKSSFKGMKNEEFGELFLNDPYEKKLPLGIYYRFHS
jgi:23S rRNA (cytosine1962-C5)-methyltransferase